jgi:exocyst complex component 2
LSEYLPASGGRLIVSRILIELDSSDEPAWAYLDYQHAHILETMRSLFKKAAEQAKSTRGA